MHVCLELIGMRCCLWLPFSHLLVLVAFGGLYVVVYFSDILMSFTYNK